MIVIFVLIWLAASALILRPRVRELIRHGGTAMFSDSTPSAVIGGRNAYVKDYARRSMIQMDNVPAWYDYNFEVTLSPAPGNGGRAQGVNAPWVAVSIDAPFHIVFRRPDGTVTDPLRVDFSNPYRLQWNANGDAILTHLWHGANVGTTERTFARRQWNARVVLTSLTHPLLLIAAIAVALSVAALIIIKVQQRRRARPNMCAACGYDLSGCVEPGCPECGAGRGGAIPGDEDKSAADQQPAGPARRIPRDSSTLPIRSAPSAPPR
jgi:hypothetical protein